MPPRNKLMAYDYPDATPASSVNQLIAGNPGVGMGDAATSTTDALSQWIADQRAQSSAMGLWNDQTGLPTSQGVQNALMNVALGTAGPKMKPPVSVWHGSLSDFNTYDPSLSGTGAAGEGYFAEPNKLPPYMYSTSEKEHAALYGAPKQFQLSGKIQNYNAVPELKSWARELGYKTPQSMIDDYFNGDAYQALGGDQYFLDKMRQAGTPHISVDFGDLLHKTGDNSKVKLGKVYISSDPSLISRVPDNGQ